MEEDLWDKTSKLVSAYDQMMADQNIARVIETSQEYEIDHWPKSSAGNGKD